VKNPEIACIVSIDEPRFGTHHGGEAAAPIFARVVADALRALGVQPETDPKTLVSGDFHVYDMPKTTVENNANARIEAQNNRAANTNAADANPSEAASKQGEMVVPDLSGMSLREAMNLCARRGLKVQPTGEGVITSQSPPPGAYISQNAICHVRLSKQIASKAKAATGKKDEPKQMAKKQTEQARSRLGTSARRSAGARSN
jgi:hypothetical protein